MATRTLGNNCVVVMKEEATYGTAPDMSTGVTILPDMFDCNKEVEEIATGQKTNKIQMKDYETVDGRNFGTGTITGALAPVHEIILQGALNKDSSPYTIQNTHAPKSYTMIYYDIENDIQIRVCKGVVFDSPSLVEISSGDIVKYSCGLRAKEVIENQSSTDGDYITIPAITCADWGDRTANPEYTPFKAISSITLGNLTSITSFNSATLSLAHTFMDDENSFQQAFTRQQELVYSVSGEFTCNVNYRNDITPSEYIQGSIVNCTFTLTSGAITWAVSTYGKITASTLPQAEKGILLLDVTYNLMGDCDTSSPKEALTITVA